MYEFLWALCNILIIGSCVQAGGLHFHHPSSELFIAEGQTFFVGQPDDDCNNGQKIYRGTVRNEGTIDGTLCFDCATLIDCCSKASFSGTYHGDTKSVELYDNDCIILGGKPDLIKKIIVKGKHVTIEGAPICHVKRPCFIKIEEGASARIGLQSHVPGNICFSGNCCKDGRIILCDALRFNDDISLKGFGTVKAQDYPVEFYGEILTLDHNICWYNAKNINLFAKKTDLTGTWTFQTTGHINGHGGILDLCGCPDRIVVKAGQTLYITDLKIKCIENITIECGARVVVSNVELELGRDYLVTEGEWVFCGPTTIITKEYRFGCQEGCCDPHIIIEEGTTVFIDTLGRACGGFDCNTPCVINKGRCCEVICDVDTCQTTLISSDVALTGDLCVTGCAPLFVSGSFCDDYPDNKIIRIDGCGYCINLSNHPDIIKIAEGTTLLLENVNLCGFSPCAIQTTPFVNENGNNALLLLSNGERGGLIPITGFDGTTPGRLVIGRGVTLKLTPGVLSGCQADSECGGIALNAPLLIDFGLGPQYADIPALTVIDGRGYTLNIEDNPIIFNSAGTGTLLLRDIRLLGLHNTGYGARCPQESTFVIEHSDGTVVFEDARLYLTGDYTYCHGFMNFCRTNVIETSCQGHVFTHRSDRPSTILRNSSLLIAPKVTYRHEYQPQPGLSPLHGLVLFDETSIVKFDGSTFSVNENGFCFKNNGCLFIDNHVLFEADNKVDVTKSIKVPASLTVEILAAAVLECDGMFCVVEECP